MMPTPDENDHWTLVSVVKLMDERDRRYEERYEAQNQALAAAMSAAEKAVLKAEASSERRFESVNEFRGTLSDQAGRLMPRAEVEVSLKALGDKITEAMSRLDRSAGDREGGRHALSQGQASVQSVVGVVGGVVGLLSLIILALSLMGSPKFAQQAPTLVSPAVVPVLPSGRP